ncbi:MAG TPA: SpoIID/LytB domain-containing protein [Terracidiphilus sp.]|nr:SpoIID/LytB domain-containing protein [Terracidiphilus sp.]
MARTSTLRIGLWTLWHDKQLSVAPGPNAAWKDCERCKTLTEPWPFSVRADGNNLVVSLGIESATLRAIYLSGSFTLTAHNESETLYHPLAITASNGELVLAVTLPVETYVERVVASESGPADSPQSLRALAIVVRTYALHVRHGHKGYDLCDSTHCQLLHWHGVPDRAPAAHAATLATAGETLWFHHQPALAYFNKDCGGHTATPAEIWPAAPEAPYLPSRPDSYCARSGSNDWASDLSRQDISSALAARGLAPSGWQHLAVARRAPSDRVLTVRLDNREISAEGFRLAVGAALGWNRIPSTWFEISEQGDRFYFHGRGWGHGVGLCQKGAAAMAAQGHSASEILNQYFPGAVPLDDATGRAWTGLAGPGFTLESLDPGAERFLPELARARAEASQRSGLDPAATFTIRAFPSTPAFRNATLAPGWVAAFTEGDWIATQPLAILSARHLLAGTMRHEFLHALIESHAGPQAPLWLREGLVELWSESGDSASAATHRMPTQSLTSVDAALAHATTEAQSATAHRDAAIFAGRLLDRYGRDQVLRWLRSGLPLNLVASLR